MNIKWTNEEIESGRRKTFFFLIAAVLLVLTSGCMTIDTISQPSSTIAGDQISTTMTVSLQSNTSGYYYAPGLALKIPNSWSVYSVYYSGTGGAYGMNEYMSYNGSATSDIESRFSSGADYQWKVYSGMARRVNTLPAGATVTVSLTTGSTTGTYNINYTVGFYSNGWLWWDSELKSITLNPNSPPNTPTLSGPTSGTAGTPYTFSAAATDPNTHTIYYTFEWGDATTGVTSYYSSGSTGTKSKTWATAGTYNVRVKATDVRGASSGWSGFQTVTITSVSVTTPPPEVGSISVVSSPSNAEVYLDGTLKGNASQMLTGVSTGAHVIWCKKTGYEDFMQSVDVPTGGFATLTCSMVPSTVVITPGVTAPEVTPTVIIPTPTAPTPEGTVGTNILAGKGMISVVSSPDGAEVYIDGVLKGNAYKTVPNVSIGQHMVWCKKEGYEVFQQVVTVTAGEATAVTCNLEQSSVETTSETETPEETETIIPVQTPQTSAPDAFITFVLILSVSMISRKRRYD